MSSHREPMWFCHECHAEMRPLMVPDPQCASCRGTFVEIMDNPSDDPRHDGSFPSSSGTRGNAFTENDASGRTAGGIPNILEALSEMFTRPRDREHDGGRQAPEELGRNGGLRVIIDTPSGTRTVHIGGASTLRTAGEGDREGGAPLLSEFLDSSGSAASSDANRSYPTRRAPAPLLASYLLSNLLGGLPGPDRRAGMGTMDPFEMLAGGRFGDYVVNEQALQNILNELMANGGAQPTDPPAPEAVIDSFPRVVLEEGNPLASDSCSVCHEPFNPALAASPDAFSSHSSPTNPKDEGPSLVGITLPCDHTFHEECILPWMRMKSTCPVCRKSVLPSSENSGSGPNTSSATGERPNHHDASDSRVPGGWDALD